MAESDPRERLWQQYGKNGESSEPEQSGGVRVGRHIYNIEFVPHEADGEPFWFPYSHITFGKRARDYSRVEVVGTLGTVTLEGKNLRSVVIQLKRQQTDFIEAVDPFQASEFEVTRITFTPAKD